MIEEAANRNSSLQGTCLILYGDPAKTQPAELPARLERSMQHPVMRLDSHISCQPWRTVFSERNDEQRSDQ